MAKDVKFQTSVKYVGIFNFREFYEFCFKWLKEEMGMTVIEKEYEEKVKGNEKELKIVWLAISKPAEYFNFNVDGEFETSAKMKVWRSMYEKFLVPSRIKQYEDGLIGGASEFASQMKEFLDIEGRM